MRKETTAILLGIAEGETQAFPITEYSTMRTTAYSAAFKKAHPDVAFSFKPDPANAALYVTRKSQTR